MKYATYRQSFKHNKQIINFTLNSKFSTLISDNIFKKVDLLMKENILPPLIQTYATLCELSLIFLAESVQ